jgi:predicted RNase H-like nuclease (RuvC/YqgF family)
MIIIPDTMRRPAEVEREELRKQLAEARAEAERWKSECNALQRMVHEARAEIERKDRLIEQMREALRLALPEARSTHVEQTILAALVAERGE